MHDTMCPLTKEKDRTHLQRIVAEKCKFAYASMGVDFVDEEGWKARLTKIASEGVAKDVATKVNVILQRQVVTHRNKLFGPNGLLTAVVKETQDMDKVNLRYIQERLVDEESVVIDVPAKVGDNGTTKLQFSRSDEEALETKVAQACERYLTWHRVMLESVHENMPLFGTDACTESVSIHEAGNLIKPNGGCRK